MRNTFLKYMRLIVVCHIFLISIFVGNFCLALDNELVNLCRLSITEVTASSINGGRGLDDEYYGILNLFDNGKHFINNINYTSWLTDGETVHWVMLSFDSPVTVYSLAIEVGDKSSTNYRPKEYAVEINHNKILGVKPIAGFLTTEEFREPYAKVRQIKIIFPGAESVEVSEIRVMGKVEASVALDEQEPRLGKVIDRRDDFRATHIKIENISPYDYELLVINGEFYDVLKSGDYTEYRVYNKAYGYASVKLAINGEVFKLIPQDYVGEKTLGRGFFTYKIGVFDYDKRQLSIEAVRDK